MGGMDAQKKKVPVFKNEMDSSLKIRKNFNILF